MDFSSPALKHLEVTLRGEWSREPHVHWRGVAAAEEPIVAVAFLTRETEVHWCKSEREHASSAPVRLALFRYDRTGEDVQVHFLVGEGGRRWRTLLPSSHYQPAIEPGPYVTGRVQLFARIEGTPRVECHVLFLAAQQVRVGRSGLWRVREEVAVLLESRMRRLLSRGRTGTLRGGITTGSTGPATPAGQPEP